MRNVQLKHIDALLRHLGLIKAKLLTLKREDPFMNKISDDFKQPLNEKLMENLDRLCHHMKPEITLGKNVFYFIGFFRHQLLCSLYICREFLRTFLRYQLLKISWGFTDMFHSIKKIYNVA